MIDGLPRANALARVYCSGGVPPGMTLEDVASAALVGMWQAERTFDGSRGSWSGWSRWRAWDAMDALVSAFRRAPPSELVESLSDDEVSLSALPLERVIHRDELRGVLKKLTPTQREDFYKAGEALYNASKGRFGETVTQYDGIAKQYGLDAQFIPKAKDQPKLQRNVTAIYKAREAIKAGADPEAVKQRLREQGYDDGGL